MSMWYKPEEIFTLIRRERPSLEHHASWLAKHLNAAFDKGKQIGEGDAALLRAEVARLQLAVQGERQACAMVADNVNGDIQTRMLARDAILARGNP